MLIAGAYTAHLIAQGNWIVVRWDTSHGMWQILFSGAVGMRMMYGSPER